MSSKFIPHPTRHLTSELLLEVARGTPQPVEVSPASGMSPAKEERILWRTAQTSFECPRSNRSSAMIARAPGSQLEFLPLSERVDDVHPTCAHTQPPIRVQCICTCATPRRQSFLAGLFTTSTRTNDASPERHMFNDNKLAQSPMEIVDTSPSWPLPGERFVNSADNREHKPGQGSRLVFVSGCQNLISRTMCFGCLNGLDPCDCSSHRRHAVSTNPSIFLPSPHCIVGKGCHPRTGGWWTT